MDNRIKDENITCPKCRHRHPAGRTCDEAKRLADEAQAARQTLEELPNLDGIDFLQTWIRTPNPLLGNVRPIDMLKIGKGDRLAKFLENAFEEEQPLCGKGGPS